MNGLQAHRTALAAGAVFAILIAAAVIYAPAASGGFVWDDKLCLHDSAALRSSSWTHFLFRDFCEWVNYFRPLSVAVLTLEVRSFSAEPGPMHVVSIALHLANTLLVGMLGLRLVNGTRGSTALLPAPAMLIYALHPALVEPVVWIGCQYDLLATFFTLSALIANTSTRVWVRAAGVSVFFLMAAGAKESGLALLPLLPVFDALRQPDPDWRTRATKVVRQQWPTYLAVLAAVLVYFALRRWALGTFVQPAGVVEPFFTFAHFQEVCRVLVAFLRTIVWPMSGTNPLHQQTDGEFAVAGAESLLIDTFAVLVVVFALWLARRAHALGFQILAAIAALAPVLHVIPLKFDGSLYHERYAMTAIAVTCVLLPWSLGQSAILQRRWRVAASSVAFVWVLLSVINIRVTLPLWANDVALWQWALRVNPDSVVAKDHLLTAYLNVKDYRRAHDLAESIIASRIDCPTCILNAAIVALAEKDASRASEALQLLRDETRFASDPQFFRVYVFATGQLLELQGDLEGAENAYRAAMAMDPLEATAPNALALLLLKKGDIVNARAVMESTLALLAPDRRRAQRKDFEVRAAAIDAH